MSVTQPVRSRRIAARLWWWLLPYAGSHGYRDADDSRLPLYVYPLAWAWKLVRKLPSSAPFEQ